MINSNKLNFLSAWTLDRSFRIYQCRIGYSRWCWIWPQNLNYGWIEKEILWLKLIFIHDLNCTEKKFVQIIIILQSIVFSHRNKSTRPHIRSFPIFCFYTKVIIGEVDQLQNYLQFHIERVFLKSTYNIFRKNVNF